MKFIIVTGDRNWNNKKKILDTFNEYKEQFDIKETTVIEGGCRGTDLLSKSIAEKLGYTIKEFPPDWKKYGLAAGPIRNKEMYTYAKENAKIKDIIVFCFHNDLKNSKGTKSMISICKKDLNIIYKN